MNIRTRAFQTSAAALAVFAAAAVVATWPLVRSPGRVLAGGLGDPLLTTAILAWDADRIRHGLHGLWDAPFLYPHRYTLAYSEHFLGIALFTTPIVWISGNPVLAFNVAYFGSYVLAGFGMFLLVRTLSGRADAAILAALAFELTPYRLEQSPHLQVLMNGWMPIALWALHNYFATGRRRWIVTFTAAFALLGLSNGYYFYFFLVPLLVVCAIEFLTTNVRRTQVVADMTGAALALLAVVGPIAWVYFQLQRQAGFSRTDEELSGLSAHFGDYLRVPSGGWTWRGMLGMGAPERELFQGFTVMTFAALGAAVVRTRAVAAYLTITILAVWLSMGPGGGPTYVWLFHHVPGFNGLRVPARFAAVVIVGLAVLAGAAFAWVLAHLPRRAGAAWTIAIAAIIVLEGQRGVGVTPVAAAGETGWDRVAYDWLRASPPGAVLELQITQRDDFHVFTTMYQLEAVRHHHPIVNGYSGWNSELQEWLGGPASPLRDAAQLPDALNGLRAIGVRYVLLHEWTFARPEDAAQLVAGIRAARDQIEEEQRFGQTWAWRLASAERPKGARDAMQAIDGRALMLEASQQNDRVAFLVDGDLDTRWVSGVPQGGDERIDMRLPRETDVARVDITSAARSQSDYPRHLAIESIDDRGEVRRLFDGGIVRQLIQAFAIDEQYPRVAIDLPPNRSITVRIRQTARADSWWSIHELRLFERRRDRASR